MKVHIKGKGVLLGTTLLDEATQKPKCHRFSRVPYALSPTGTRRWRKPESLPASFSYGTTEEPGNFMKESLICPQLSRKNAIQANYSEDCLQLNIWVPLGVMPEGGWPVFFYIHGGFLQYGSNSSEDPSALISETDVKCILISPNYRLGILGFLASKELCSNPSGFEANFGFWDQRLALEWTYENISAFGGNKGNVTVGGLSAGSYSAFHQLAHDIGRQNCGPQIIRRVFLWSNGCGVEPKPLDEAQDQFNELLMHLNIPLLTPATVKLDTLRTTPVEKLMQAVEKLNCKFSRPIMDHNFVSDTLFPDIYSGKFGARLKELGIQIMIGDLTQEYHLYKFSYPPKSLSQFTRRLCWDYPKKIVDAICKPYMGVVMTEAQWAEVFGKLYADMQIHSTMRGLIDCIVQTLPSSQIYRYRIDWRTRSVDKRIPKALGATHATDLSIWFFGNGEAPMEQEKVIIKEWLKPVAQFLQGTRVIWGTNGVKQVRYLTNEGKIEIRDDEVWDVKLPLWKLTQHITSQKVFREAKL